MRLGVDLGTTWTAAAIHGDDGCEAVQLAQHTIAMPSVVAIADGELVAGEAAERRLATDPAAGAREFKRRLGDSTPYVLDGAPYGAEALMGHVLRHVITAAEAQAGERPTEVTLTHPANWGEFKLDLLRESARIAGLDGVDLMSEPEAAARHYANLGRLEPGQAVAVFDFGGGTFDAAVVRNGDDGPELLGTPEGLERLGGVDLDHAVLAHVDATLDGKLRDLDTTDPAVRAAVARLRVECTAAKEALSSDTEAAIEVAVPGLETQIRVSRGELEQVLAQRMDDMLAALGRSVSSSGLAMEDLSGVLLVGGSSRMPAVAELVAKATGLPTLIDADPKLVVAAGAAWPRGAIAAGGTASPAPGDSTERSQGSSPRAAGKGAGGPSARRSEMLRRAVALGGATTAIGAVAVGGYYAYRTWMDDDETVDAAGLAADEAAADELVESLFADAIGASAADADSLDAFEGFEAAGGPGLAGSGGPFAPPGGGPFGMPQGPPAGGPPFAPRMPQPPPPRSTHSAPRHRPHDDDGPDRPSPPPMPQPSRPSHQPPPAPTDDHELDAVRTQLRERVAKLDLPEGTDPADAAKLRADLDGLLDRYNPSSGQSIEDAVDSLRYEFEDRVRDFAQDQRIKALIEEQREKDGEEAEGGAPAEDGALPDVFDDVLEDDPPMIPGEETTTVPGDTTDMPPPPTTDSTMPDDGWTDDADHGAHEAADDVLGTGVVDDAVNAPTGTDPLILTEPAPPPPDPSIPAAPEPPPGDAAEHVDDAPADSSDEPSEPDLPDPVDMPAEPDDSMDDVPAEPEHMESLPDPLGV